MTTKAASKRERIDAVVAALEAEGLGMTKQEHPLVYIKETEWGKVVFYPNSLKWPRNSLKWPLKPLKPPKE